MEERQSLQQVLAAACISVKLEYSHTIRKHKLKLTVSCNNIFLDQSPGKSNKRKKKKPQMGTNQTLKAVAQQRRP